MIKFILKIDKEIDKEVPLTISYDRSFQRLIVLMLHNNLTGKSFIQFVIMSPG